MHASVHNCSVGTDKYILLLVVNPALECKSVTFVETTLATFFFLFLPVTNTDSSIQKFNSMLYIYT